MRQLQKLIILILAVGLVAWAVTDIAWAQSRGRSGGGTSGTGFQYVVKFTCGEVHQGEPLTDSLGELAPGLYYTDVNIHNPNDKIIKFRKKIALDGFQGAEHHGLQTSPVDVTLGPDEALEINCTDIIRLLLGDGQFAGVIPLDPYVPGTQFFLAGYVVLYAKEKVDVAGIYTACGHEHCDEDPGSGITTIQVDELIPFDGVPPPTVFVKGLSVSSASVNLSVQPFSPFAYDGARLMIYDQSGRALHDSGFTSGTELNWKPLAAGGRPLANGVYFYVVEVRDVLGQIGYKTGKFALLR